MIEERAAQAVRSVRLANNGYADIGTDESIVKHVEEAGIVVIRTTDLHGKPVLRGFTPQAQKALAVSPFGASTYKNFASALGGVEDLEGRILARQESRLSEFA